MDFLVAERLGACLKDLEVVVAGQSGDAVGAGHPHFVLGLGVVGLEIGERDRPVEKVGTFDVAVGGLRLEFVLLKAQRSAGPVGRCSADCLDDPGGQVGEILRHPPVTGGGAIVEPGELAERVPFVVDEVLVLDALAGFQDDDVDALLGQFVAERAAAGARADDDDDAVVVQCVRCCHVLLPRLAGARLRATRCR